MGTAQADFDSNLKSLMAAHGPGTAGEYTPAVLGEHRTELCRKAFAPLQDEFDAVVKGAQHTLEHAADFSREGILRNATVPTPGKDNDDPMLREMKRLNANIELDRTSRAIGAATDEDLAGRYAQQAIKDRDLPLASLLLDEGARRGDVTGMRVRQVIDTLDLPEVDADTEHLEHLEREIKDLEAALSDLRTGEKSRRTQMNEAVQRNRDFAARKAG
jgi:hypothetical protein